MPTSEVALNNSSTDKLTHSPTTRATNFHPHFWYGWVNFLEDNLLTNGSEYSSASCKGRCRTVWMYKAGWLIMRRKKKGQNIPVHLYPSTSYALIWKYFSNYLYCTVWCECYNSNWKEQKKEVPNIRQETTHFWRPRKLIDISASCWNTPVTTSFRKLMKFVDKIKRPVCIFKGSYFCQHSERSSF